MRPQKRRTGPYQALSQMVAQVGIQEGSDDRLGVPMVADFLGMSPSTLYKLMDPDQGGDLSFVRVCQITERFGVPAAAEHLAGCAGLVAAPEEPATDIECMSRLMSKLSKGEGDLLSLFLEALSDQHLDSAERATMDAKVTDLIRCLVTIRRALRSDAKSAVVIPIKGQVA